MSDTLDPTTNGDIDAMSDAISQTEDEQVAAILKKHWLDGSQEGDPQPLTDDEVRLLEERLPSEFAAEDFEDRGDGKFWHVETWYDFRNTGWMRDEYGKVY